MTDRSAPPRFPEAKARPIGQVIRVVISLLCGPARSSLVAMFRVVLGSIAASALLFSASLSLPHCLVARESHQQLVFHAPWWSGPLCLLGLLLALAVDLLAVRDGVTFLLSGLRADDRNSWNDPATFDRLAARIEQSGIPVKGTTSNTKRAE